VVHPNRGVKTTCESCCRKNDSFHYYRKKYFSILETRPELKYELTTLLKNMRATGQGLSTPIVKPIIRGIFESRAPELLKDFTKQRGFKVSLEWTRYFMKYHLSWSYRTTTTTIGKLPSTWEAERTSMAH
jgi:hypothetical protein